MNGNSIPKATLGKNDGISEVSGEQKVCHGDFCPDNIIIDESGKAYIIDWANASLGDPSFDAAISYSIFLRDGRKDLAELYLAKYSEKTATDRNNIVKRVLSV